MACMTPAADGMRISIDDPEAAAFRAGVIEWLMINHPHDCPVCDEGGECHLQDMTVMTGHVYRRYRFTQAHAPQPGPRAVRQPRDEPLHRTAIAACGSTATTPAAATSTSFGWHDHVYFGRHADGTLESEFSGNLVEVCPTGVFTDKTLEAALHPQMGSADAPRRSACIAALGCNTIPGERYGTLRRIRNRYNGEVNGYFLCDRGRFGYEFVNSARAASASPCFAPPAAERPAVAATRRAARAPVLARAAGRSASARRGPRWRPTSPCAAGRGRSDFYRGLSEHECRLVDAAIGTAAAWLRAVALAARGRPGRRGAGAGRRRDQHGADAGPGAAPSRRCNREIDLTRRLHIHWWDDAAVREALQQRRGPLFIATPAATRLDDVATQSIVPRRTIWCASPLAITYALGADVPPVQACRRTIWRRWSRRSPRRSITPQRPLVVSRHRRRKRGHDARGGQRRLGPLSRQDAARNSASPCPSATALGLGLIGGGSLDDACRAVARRTGRHGHRAWRTICFVAPTRIR